MAVEILNDDADDGNQEIPVEKLDAAPENKAPAPDKDKPKRKFEGKTPEEIEAAYEALEQRFGSQGAELGELRKLTDGIIRSSLVEKQKDPAPKQHQEPSTTNDPDSEFFVNPRAAVRRMLEEDEMIQELRNTQTLTQQERAQALLKKKHEDANTLIQDTEFQEWVKASPTRTKLLVQAHRDLDVDAADELFSTFKELRKVRTAQAATREQGDEIVEAQKKAAGAPSGTTGNTESSKSKPVYSRRKIMELMINNPDEYAARNDEFLAAYAEGRVKP